MTIKEYIAELDRQFQTGVAREHTYRPALQNLLATMLPHLTVSNEPARQACGAPDYILQRSDTNIPVAFIEAKDLEEPLDGRKKHKEQFDRYKQSLDNIIFTDYLDFHLWEKGEFVDSIRIADIKSNKIVGLPEAYEKFEHLIKRFGDAKPQKITSSTKLAEIMAGKARLLAAVIEKTITQGGNNGSLAGQMAAFKDVLIHEITPQEFADVYAQTIAYGMFAARLHDKSPDTFSRQEAATLIPKTNPFLRQLFQSIAGLDIDDNIGWIVDDLAESFRATDIHAVMKGFGKRTQQNDPIIHFYENFLSAYDPKLRKSRGVWYTPQAVVNFIVRSVDEILQTEFGLPMGLADTSKIKLERSIDQSQDKRYADNKKKEMREYHKVQILDPATGTGTFLAETVSQIYEKFKGQAGMWQGYVEDHLIPRLNGFELLMASYTMAHIKLDMLLTETGYMSQNNERLRVYLTNSLEEHHPDTGTLWSQFLAREANEANGIKRDTPVMVVMGNPPYSGESSNKGEWMLNLMEDYKREPDTKLKLQERNPKMINDDYCKFIRLGQHFVDKNSEGVLAYINNHSFIDNITFRGMRWNLMKSFDKIYIVDLHGNSKKNEICPDGSPDINVFDIQQGVSINIFIKTGKKATNELAEVYHYDLFGKRQVKYDYLTEAGLRNVPFIRLHPESPDYFFIPKDYGIKEKYDNGFSITELMPINSVGIVTSNDKVLINTSSKELVDNVSNHYDIVAKDEIVKPISYRPFDVQNVYYDTALLDRSRDRIMRHFFNDNMGLIASRQCVSDWRYVFITKYVCCKNLSGTAGRFGSGNVFPLYLYPEQADLLGDNKRVPNLDPKIVEKIAKTIKLEFEPEKTNSTDHFAPIDLLDYIYAVLHSTAYREKYKEFLKIDFPRVPYPENAEQFRRMAILGSEFRRVHLMEHPELSQLVTTYPVGGSNTVEKPRWELNADGKTGKVWINTEQYFEGVPLTAWEFYIGGYQPAQKWLKDRTGRTLAFDDIMHYQRIIKALVMTREIMTKI